MEMTQATGLASTFFTIVFFTAVGFMIQLPLDRQGGKAVIQYLALGLTLVLAQGVLADAVNVRSVPGWWPAVVWLSAAVWIVTEAVPVPDRRGAAAGMGISILLILFCMGVSYIAAHSLAMLTGLRIPWPAASMMIAALVRNTTGMTEEEFPDEQCATLRTAGLLVMAVTLVMPA